jgi:hypothetical protein
VTFEPPVSIAFEDEYGVWWQYDPDTGLLHDTPSLYMDYYFRAEDEQLRFTRLSPGEARRRIASGFVDSPTANPDR